MASGDIPVRHRSESPDVDDRGTSWTLASSAHDYRIEHGRTYQGRGTHPVPNDELNAESERHAHHFFLIMLHDRLHLAPVKRPKRILDIGSGIGIWALGMADLHPNAQVVGLDLNPNSEFTPPNCELRVEDVRGEWLPDNTDFDFVHMRNLVPGGYVEHVETEILPRCDDDTFDKDSPLLELANVARSMSEKSGKDFHISDSMHKLMRGANFTEIKEWRYKVPLGPWSSDAWYRELGTAFENYFRTGIQGWILRILTNDFGWTVQRVDELINRCFESLNSRREHLYYEIVVMYARKPTA